MFQNQAAPHDVSQAAGAQIELGGVIFEIQPFVTAGCVQIPEYGQRT